MTSPATKQQYIDLRESRVEQEMQAAWMLEKAGANDGFALLRAIAEARRLELDTWSSLDHDDRMAILEQDNRATTMLVEQIRERTARDLAGGAGVGR